MAYALTINGVTRTIQPGWDISRVANGTGKMQFKIVSLDGSYVPDLDQEVVFTDSGTRIFGGHIDNVREVGLVDRGVTPIVSEVSALDFNDLTTRLYYGLGLAGTLKFCLQTLLPYIPGVTLDPAQVTGPTIAPVTYSAWKIKDILNQLTTLSGGYVWEIDYNKVLRMTLPGSIAAPVNVTHLNGVTDGDVKTEWMRQNYYNSVIVWGTGYNASANDAAQQAIHGVWQLLVRSPDSTTQAAVDTLAAAILAASLPIVKRAEYNTYQTGIKPGQTQTINIPARHINNTFLIYDVSARNIGNLVRYSVKAIEGLQYVPGWREDIRSTGNSGGVTTPGIGVGVPFIRYAYFLGGSGLDFVQTATSGQWIAASPIQVQIDTVVRGTTLATVKGRVRALNAGISVQARLYDVTAGAACPGVSSVITSTSWSSISFGVILTPGSHLYELQLQPSVGLEEVGAVAYVE